MYRWVIGAVVGVVLSAPLAEAQTITGRIEPVWDAEREYYTYGLDESLLWRLRVAPSLARSDELSVYLYYNKRAAQMVVDVHCTSDPRDEDDLKLHARSFSGEHFLSLTTGLITGDACWLRLYGFSNREEVLSYRMAVSERVTRATDELEVSIAAAAAAAAAGMSSVARAVAERLRSGARPQVAGRSE